MGAVGGTTGHLLSHENQGPSHFSGPPRGSPEDQRPGGLEMPGVGTDHGLWQQYCGFESWPHCL